MESINLTGILKKYHSKTILNNIDFIFESGKCYVLRGESGCGKTTLLNILAGYIAADSGQLQSLPKIEYLFQDEMLFSNLTVEENMRIKLYSDEKNIHNEEELIISALEKFNISSLVNQKISVLSGGERQRVELASILLTNPDIVLLDEPTAKLDEENKKNILIVITSAFAGKTLIAVTHEKELFPDEFIKLRLQEGKLIYEK